MKLEKFWILFIASPDISSWTAKWQSNTTERRWRTTDFFGGPRFEQTYLWPINSWASCLACRWSWTWVPGVFLWPLGWWKWCPIVITLGSQSSILSIAASSNQIDHAQHCSNLRIDRKGSRFLWFKARKKSGGILYTCNSTARVLTQMLFLSLSFFFSLSLSISISLFLYLK